MTRTVRVEGGGFAGYDVVVGEGLIAEAGARIADLGFSRVFVVADATVDDLHGDRLRAGLDSAGVSHAGMRLASGEASKSFDGLRETLAAMAHAGLDRKSAVIAFGGGVTGDLAGLTAALWMRGVALIQIPTTLLAQVDSSVGGKTAIDLPQGKNLVGAFHQPRLVLADVAALATLPARQLRSGWAEALKHGLICDPDYFEALTGVDGAALTGDGTALARVVARSVEIKAEIVGRDEREAGARALLNLGHTFGHAIEAELGFDDEVLTHGEAVALGCCLAFRFSERQGLCDAGTAARVEAAFAGSGLPTGLDGGWGLSARALLTRMAGDKKAEGGRLTLVLARGVGAAFVAKDVDAGEVEALLKAEGAA
ncbi:MAG TPA: 3-dehydroquinate synthase [Brevundimonas sp.]|jgi:3-dehydroquinate synthase|uniref:3-dehydroquinate synthase n=1 Tax=Brevundimonas sp. TaxID=1871086 RepID=UPI002DF498B1|nr:3-dehydroquinate synthase [Brevundimonas sp.]